MHPPHLESRMWSRLEARISSRVSPTRLANRSNHRRISYATLTLTITITLRPGEAQLRLWCDASARPCDADAFLTRCFDIVTQCAATARPVLKIQTASVDSEPWDVLLPTGVPRSEHGFI